MAEPVNPPPSKPRFPVREARARQTRQHVLAAASTLFVADGYGATSIQAIADEAGVAVQTVYAVFGNKRSILAELLDVAIAGDDEQVSINERTWMEAVFTAPTAEARLRGYAAAVRSINGRAGHDDRAATPRRGTKRHRLRGLGRPAPTGVVRRRSRGRPVAPQQRRRVSPTCTPRRLEPRQLPGVAGIGNGPRVAGLSRLKLPLSPPRSNLDDIGRPVWSARRRRHGRRSATRRRLSRRSHPRTSVARRCGGMVALVDQCRGEALHPSEQGDVIHVDAAL
jgi:AcrR family transcriptional regulator